MATRRKGFSLEENRSIRLRLPLFKRALLYDAAAIWSKGYNRLPILGGLDDRTVADDEGTAISAWHLDDVGALERGDGLHLRDAGLFTLDERLA